MKNGEKRYFVACSFAKDYGRNHIYDRENVKLLCGAFLQTGLNMRRKGHTTLSSVGRQLGSLSRGRMCWTCLKKAGGESHNEEFSYD